MAHKFLTHHLKVCLSAGGGAWPLGRIGPIDMPRDEPTTTWRNSQSWPEPNRFTDKAKRRRRGERRARHQAVSNQQLHWFEQQNEGIGINQSIWCGYSPMKQSITWGLDNYAYNLLYNTVQSNNYPKNRWSNKTLSSGCWWLLSPQLTLTIGGLSKFLEVFLSP